MKFTLSRQLARLRRRIVRYVKKSKNSRRFVLMMIAIWLVIPVIPVDAADITSATNSTQNITLAYGEVINPVQSTISVEVRQSAYQQKVVATAKAKPVVTVRVAKVAEPSLEEKRAWVQKAAATWGIDWKILEAVWQVESGKQWYTTVRSYAGAQGPCQFMPGTWRAYAQDGNGDGVKDVYDAQDCLFASAKLLAVNGAASGDVDRALLRYNASLAYVAKVINVASSIEG